MKKSLANLKQAEIFALLAMFFLIMLVSSQNSMQLPATRSAYPPSIPIPSDALYFETAKAFPEEGPNYLREYVKENIVPKLKNQLDRYDVNMIEVIGHTDGSPVNGRGTLDRKLLNELAGLNTADSNIEYNELVEKFRKLQAGSNADLGLIRALIVVKTLQDLLLRDEYFSQKIEAFKAYSAGQLYSPSSEPFAAPANSNSDPQRRRIEVRFTKWNPT